MSAARIKGLILQDVFIYMRNFAALIDLPFFSFMAVVSMGLISRFISNSSTFSFFGNSLLLGVLLWEVVRICQYSVTIGTFWNLWSRNLTNMFISPVSTAEFLMAAIISAVVKTIIIIVPVALLANLLFGFNLFSLGVLPLAAYFINLFIFALSIGVLVIAVVFRWGNDFQALGWGLVYVFQPLMAVFFPVKILPSFLQTISYALPPTFVFEAARANLLDKSFNWGYFKEALILNIFYLVLSLLFFHLMFLKSRKTGKFARLEG